MSTRSLLIQPCLSIAINIICRNADIEKFSSCVKQLKKCSFGIGIKYFLWIRNGFGCFQLDGVIFDTIFGNNGHLFIGPIIVYIFDLIKGRAFGVFLGSGFKRLSKQILMFPLLRLREFAFLNSTKFFPIVGQQFFYFIGTVLVNCDHKKDSSFFLRVSFPFAFHSVPHKYFSW